MIDGRLRSKVEAALAPVGRMLHGLGVSADGLTLVGLALAIGTGALIANGNLVLAVVGVIACGVPDILDGSVARHSGTVGGRGAFFDSVCDRVADAALFIGVGWHLTSESAELPVLAMTVLALSMLITYERARAESLGFTARGGLMERAERLVLLGIGLAFDVLVPVLWIMLALTAFTALQRFVMVWRQATPAPSAESAPSGSHLRSGRGFRARRARPRRLSRVPGRR